MIVAESLYKRLHVRMDRKGYSLVHSATHFVILDRIRFLGIAEKLLLELEKEDWRFFTLESPKLTRVMERVKPKFAKILRR